MSLLICRKNNVNYPPPRGGGLPDLIKFMNIKKIRKQYTRVAVGTALLLLFLSALTFFIVYKILGAIPNNGITRPTWQFQLFFILGMILVWLIGILMVYLNSKQLGLKLRVLGIILGLIPIADLIVLIRIVVVCLREAGLELKKLKLNIKRHEEQVCATKYPILMVHGVFFRDFRFVSYWGRVPKELEYNGAKIFYGNQQSAASVEANGKELAERIKDIALNQGYGKVNIIAHSKGGLDARAAISLFGCEDYVASLTTISTPHRGCEFADFLLSKVPDGAEKAIAKTYETALKAFGDKEPNFLEAVYSLTASQCREFNKIAKDSPKVYYRSIGSSMKKDSGGRFPLNYTSKLVKMFDGPNDGLVGENSFKWGDDYRFLVPKSTRGISHGDVIDLNRENIYGFDIREFYVQLVAELKEKGF